MRLWTAACLLLGLAAMAGAAWLPAPLWLFSLYAAPLFATLFAVGLVASVLEVFLGPHLRSVAPILGAALCLFGGLYALFERAPGSFAIGPLLFADLGEKALSIVALGAVVGGALLALQGLRAPALAAQGLAVADLIVAALALGTLPRALGLPFVSPWLLGLLAAGAALFLVSSGAAEEPDPPPVTEDPEPPGPPPACG